MTQYDHSEKERLLKEISEHEKIIAAKEERIREIINRSDANKVKV